MSDIHLPSNPDSDDDGQQPEVRLELTRAGVEQVLSLYSQEQQSSRSESAFSVSFDDLQEAIRERRRMLVGGLLGGILFAILVLWMSTPLYPVSAQVILERHEVSNTQSAGGPGTASSAFVATQAEVMESRSVIADAVGSIPFAAHLDEDDNAIADAVESIQATPVSGTQVIALGYLGPDAHYGATLLEAIVESYRGVLRKNEQQSQAQKLDAKQAEIAALELESQEVEERIEAMRLENGILGSGEDAADVQSAILRDQTEQLAAVRNDRISLENRLATGGDRLAILDPATRSLQEQLWQAEAELARVKLTLMPAHPAVEAAQQEVTVLERQLRSSSSATPQALRRDIAAAIGLEEQLLAVYEIDRARMVEIERFRRKEDALLGDLDRIREMSDARRTELLDQRLLTRLAESGEVGVSARIIEAPVLPESAAWPRPKFVLAAGAVFGLLAGLVAAIVSLRQSQKVWISSPNAAGQKPAHAASPGASSGRAAS